MRRAPGFFLRLVLSSAIALSVVLPRPSAVWARSAGPFRIAAGPYVRKAENASSPAVARFTLEGLTVQVEYLEPTARAAFIRSIDPQAGDPFAASSDRGEFYNTFRVEFDNRSGSDVTFQPGNVILITDRNDQQFPIDLTDLYRTASLSEAADPQRLIDDAGRFIFDLSTTIPKGRRLARLLLFGPMPGKWKEFRLHFSFLQIGTATHTLSFPFHRQSLGG